MKYALLIYGNEASRPAENSPEAQAVMTAYFAFTQDLHQSGRQLGGEALMPTALATTVRVRNGETMITDGPFAETKEQLGGFYLVEAENLDDAIAWAAKIPGAQDGSIEVRPLMVFE